MASTHEMPVTPSTPPKAVTTKNIWDIPECPLGGQTTRMETRWPGGQCSGAREGAMSVRVLPGEPAQAGFLGTEVSRSQCFQGHDSSWEESSEAGGEGRTRQGSGPAAASAGLPSDRRLRTLGGRGGRQLVPNAPPDAGGGGDVGHADRGRVSWSCRDRVPQTGRLRQQERVCPLRRPAARAGGVGRAAFGLRLRRRSPPCLFRLLVAPGTCSWAQDPVSPISASVATGPPSPRLSASSPVSEGRLSWGLVPAPNPG